MKAKKAKKEASMTTAPEAVAASPSIPTPAEPSPQFVADAVSRFNEYNSKLPPGLTVKTNEAGGFEIDTDRPTLKNGMVALMDAVGTHDVAFFTGFITQLVNATTTGRKPDPVTANAALAFIRNIKPRDEVEAAMAAQMATTHNAVMTFARRLNHVESIPQQDSAINAYNKLARTYAAQVEALKKYRSTGEQKVTVQHIAVSDGSQAIIGNVTTGGRGETK